MIQYQSLSIANYTYPDWATGLGWIIALLSVLCIPAGMAHAVYYAKGTNIIQVLPSPFVFLLGCM